MNLDIVNDVFNNLKENNFVKSFVKELSNYLENNNKISSSYINLADLTIEGEKIISKYRNKMLSQRAEILQKYSENTKERGEMYYIYDVNSDDSNSFNLCICTPGKSHEVITKQKEQLPEGAMLRKCIKEKRCRFYIRLRRNKACWKPNKYNG